MWRPLSWLDDLIARRWFLAAAAGSAAARALLGGTVAPRVAGLVALLCVVAPVAWLGWTLVRRGPRAA